MYAIWVNSSPIIITNSNYQTIFESLQNTVNIEYLFFFTDESYIQEIYNTFSEEAIIYTYNQYAWINNDTQKMATFPGDSAIDENERKDVEVFMLYDNNDINHLHNGGFYINQTEGYICFFAQ